MKPNDFSYFIERYNAGEMSQEENLWFEKELQGNESLLHEVNLRKKTDEILKNQDVISLRNKLTEIERKRAVSVPVKNHRKLVSIQYAAVALGLILLTGSIFLLSQRKFSSSEIMKRYYTAYEPASAQRSALAKTDDDFTLGLDYYRTHDFKNAAIYFSKVVGSQPKNMYATLLNGISYFEESEYIDAKKSFGKVIDDNKNLYIDQAQWYLALCYINTGEKDKAIQMLKIIKDEGGYYSKDARRIIRKLK